ncbi:hypothetical protein BJX66DRAFT_342157 [Aspergillus keveii]|uniref:Methyltransferase domain-containing protein n=1 Tax=Aspergillus keveii TaxID=714993 RepID=A0ABR4FT85_9EURO
MGKLLLAPLQVSRENLRILDAGTSDGFWLTEFLPTLAHPETCDIIGIDITNERFPETPPRAVTLAVQTSLGAWPASFLHSFDLAHQCLVLLGAGTQSKYEHKWKWTTDEGLRSALPLFREVGAGMGSDLSFQGGAMEGWIWNEGFIHVGTMLASLCLGAECPDPGLREQSIQAYCATAQQLLQACEG